LITLNNYWILILLLSNLILYIIFTRFLITKYNEKNYFIVLIKHIKINFKYILIIGVIVIIHLIEVNFFDTITTNYIGVDFAYLINSIEGDIVYNFSNLWNFFLIYFSVVIYILIYPFTLWFSPFYYLIKNNRKSIANLTYGFAIIYFFALPFYLFFPVTNVYKFYNLSSNLNLVIPHIENFFYVTTTQNNCFPSLHVAMSIIIAWSSLTMKNRLYSYFLTFIMIFVIFSVVYLTIHWLLDIISGVLIAILTILILKYLIKVD
jgi:membrane-associated phospholipid phosphatase